MRQVIRQKIIDSIARPLPAITLRDQIVPDLSGKAMAVIGMRRAGKSTFLWQQVINSIKQGKPRNQSLYFSFEDERLTNLAATDMGLIVDEYFSLYPEYRDREQVTFLFDEIQAIPGWERFARRLVDSEQVKLFLSGSSAKLLSREVATSMRGRALESRIFPFSFREYLRHLGREPTKPFDELSKAAKSMIDKQLREYLLCGGFPETVGKATDLRYELLKSYVDVALFRDIIERHRVSNAQALHWLVRRLLSDPGALFSINRFLGDLKSQGIAVAKDSLHSYLSYLEDAFLVRIVPLATDSVRRRMVNPRKIYPADTGLIPVYDRSGKENIGHAIETAVMIELERRNAEIAYVRTTNGYEVDFLARFPEGRIELIQVTTDLSEPQVMNREVRALTEASHEFKNARQKIIALSLPGSGNLPRKITAITLAQWLLD